METASVLVVLPVSIGRGLLSMPHLLKKHLAERHEISTAVSVFTVRRAQDCLGTGTRCCSGFDGYARSLIVM
jgi:hypothetical protein